MKSPVINCYCMLLFASRHCLLAFPLIHLLLFFVRYSRRDGELTAFLCLVILCSCDTAADERKQLRKNRYLFTTFLVQFEVANRGVFLVVCSFFVDLFFIFCAAARVFVDRSERIRWKFDLLFKFKYSKRPHHNDILMFSRNCCNSHYWKTSCQTCKIRATNRSRVGIVCHAAVYNYEWIMILIEKSKYSSNWQQTWVNIVSYTCVVIINQTNRELNRRMDTGRCL